jgi:hypothetical protein
MARNRFSGWTPFGSIGGLALLGAVACLMVGCPTVPTDNGNGDQNGNANANANENQNENQNENENENENENGNDNGNGGGGNPPTLQGLVANKPLVLPVTIQAAYNDDTMFFQISWVGDRGDTHDYVRFTSGAWRKEGGPRRDAQSTIDSDPARGPTNINSTIYESRTTFMVDDPNGPNAVPGFAQFGCMLTCHDNSRAMPLWRNEDGEVTKYLNDDTPGSLDLWHHRLGRANPIGASDDQHVTRIPEGGEEGGRLADEGDGPWQTNDLDATTGNPKFAFDPATTSGLYAFKFADTFFSPMRFFRRDDAPENGGQDVPVGIDFAEAVTMGYVPAEDDTIPSRRLRQPTGSRGDITARGTTFLPDADDALHGRWRSNTQRLLDTGNPDDTALAAGNIYNIAFAVHTGMVTVRDHYVGFAMTLSLGGGDADIEAVKLAGTGRETLPDFADTTQFPVTSVNLFLPGISSYEFLIGENTAQNYVDPETGNAVDQNHAGATALLTQGLSCRACHTAASSEAFNPPQAGGFNSGAMETLVPQRGGVNTPTPIPPDGNG